MEDKTVLALAAIGAVTVLTTVALILGHDGALLASAAALVAGLGGFVAGKTTNGGGPTNGL